MSFILYHLAKNPSKQAALYEEIKHLLCKPQIELDWQLLSQFTYLKAVIKESLRLNPISIGVGRILPQDDVFSGYIVPKNVTSHQTEYFLDVKIDI